MKKLIQTKDSNPRCKDCKESYLKRLGTDYLDNGEWICHNCGAGFKEAKE